MSVTKIPTQKKIAVIQHLESTISDVFIPDEIKSKIDSIVSFVADRTPRELELFASVHFWAVYQQELMNKYSVEYVEEKLDQLKPDAQFTQSDMEHAINVLENNEYLTKVSNVVVV